MDRFAAQDLQPTASPGFSLLHSPQVELELQEWRKTGLAPFPEIPPLAAEHRERLSMTDMRLLHHICTVVIGIRRRRHENITVWGAKMLRIICLAMRKHYVLNSLLALSAYNLAWITRDEDTKVLADKYYTVAFHALQETVISFAEEDVASGLKPYQKQGSELVLYVQSQRPFRTMEAPLDSVAQLPDVQRLMYVLRSLQMAHQKLLPLQNDFYHHKLEILIEFVQALLRDLPTLRFEGTFSRFLQLKEWVFWYPPMILDKNEPDVLALAVLSQFYCVALTVEPMFPDFGASFSTLVVEPLDQITKLLSMRREMEPHSAYLQVAWSLMEVPMQVLDQYQKALLHWLSKFRDTYSDPVDHAATYAVSNPYVATSNANTYLTPPRLSPGPLPVEYRSQQPVSMVEPAGLDSSIPPPQTLPLPVASPGDDAYLAAQEPERQYSLGFSPSVYPAA
ncbi:hypothetical protein KEM55_001998, partial [Ascosphaera atra]